MLGPGHIVARDFDNDRGTAWCVGVAESLRRPLTSEELLLLQRRVAQAERYERVWRRIRRGALLAAAAGFPLWCVVGPRGTQPLWWVAMPLLYLCVMSAAAAVLAALVEIVSGFSRWLRAVFILAFAAVGAGIVVETESPLRDAALGFGALGIYLVGMFMALIRDSEFRKMAKTLPKLHADLRAGLVYEFAGVPPAEAVVPEALKRQRVRFRPEQSVTFAALPQSGVLLGVDGRLIDSYGEFQAAWDPLEVSFTAVGGGVEAPFMGVVNEHGLSQRHATRDEIEELRGHHSRLLRRAGYSFLVLTWFAAQIARLGEVALEGKLKAELSGPGWLIAMGFAAVISLRYLRLRARLGHALKSGLIAIYRDPETPEDAPPELETLLGTSVVWSERGAPAEWRRQRF